MQPTHIHIKLVFVYMQHKNLIIHLILLCAYITASFKTIAQKPVADENGKITITLLGELAKIDSLVLHYGTETLYSKIFTDKFQKRASSEVVGGLANFNLSLKNSITYFSISRPDNTLSTNISYPLLSNYIIEPGDDIKITISIDSIKKGRNYEFKFSGRGSEKLNCQIHLTSIRYNYISKEPRIFDTTFNYVKNNDIENINISQLAILTEYKSRISSNVYKTMLLNTKSETILKKVDYIYKWALRRPTDGWTDMQQLYDKLTKGLDKLSNNEEAYLSSFFTQLILKKLQIEDLLQNKGKPIDPKRIFKRIINEYTGDIGDKLVSTFFDFYATRINQLTEELETAIIAAKHPFWLNVLRSFNEISAGKTAYNFQLPDTTGKIHSLTGFKGKVVFIDFWFTGCTPCSGYYKNVLKPVENHFTGNDNVTFITICLDVNRDKWIKSIKSNLYTSGEVLNLYTEGKGFSHKVVDAYNVAACPRPIIINPSGKIHELEAGLNWFLSRDLIKSIETLLTKEATNKSLTASTQIKVNQQ